jgi:predicted phosphoribosyltransferase
MCGMNMWPTRRYVHRAEAGEALAQLLCGLEERPCVVAALPRGGVPVAVPIARELRAPLTLSFVRKVALPRNPELAVGAMDEDAHVLMNAGILSWLRAFPLELDEARRRAARELARQRELYRVRSLSTWLPEASVILVDDGPATGLTLRAAVAHARRHGARKVIVAVPFSSGTAARHLRREADRFVCPVVDSDFVAVSRYYTDFHPVSDAEVAELLERARGFAPAGG